MTVTLADLWLPIVLSAAAAWVGAAMAWMALPHHKGDFKKLPNEEAVMSAVRTGNIPPGQYMFPHCGDHSAMKDPAVKAKMDAGPWGIVNVIPKFGNMGGKMLISFIFNLLVSATIAYVATLTISRGAEFMHVFRVMGTVAIAAFLFGWIPHAIWFSMPGRTILANVADSVVFGLITGLIFAW